MDIKKTLSSLKEDGLMRSLTTLPQAGGKFIWQGKGFINFSSNDYLNLTSNNQVKQAGVMAIENYGTSSSGSRLMCGHLEIHEKLERKLAKFMGYETSLIFGSGFLTNLGVITALVSKEDCIFFDKLDHASLIDGIRLSGAKWKRFKHRDVGNLKDLLELHKDKIGQKFIIIDSVFSMDGDISPIREIYVLAQKYNAFLIVDEAHAVGVFGENSSGYCSQINIKPDIITGTFSKSLGSYGGFAACSHKVKQLLINKARPFIYSTALPPSCLGVVLESINIIEKEKLGELLLKNSKYFYNLLNDYGFNLLPFESQIIPIIIGDSKIAVKFSAKLISEGIYVKAIRPPTVPNNTARIRLSITLAHTKEDLKYTADKIYNIAKQLGAI